TILIDQADGTRRLSGFNTDVAGIVRVLAESGITRADHVCVLGAGATAASALAAAADLGAEDVEILVRTPAKAAHLVELGRALSLVVRIGELSEGPTTAGPGRLVVSTLPNGVAVAAPFSEGLRRESTLFDVSYSPWPSVLAASWQEAGGRVVSGLGMLLHQALVQVRIFVGGDPFAPLVNEEAVLEAMRGALDLSAGEGPTRPVEG
ncbi:MAG: shikimate dehydrogenase, partial [Cryobacterium sp.]|nr:shikimate dehydrogenase [Cryobacterium sp.]